MSPLSWIEHHPALAAWIQGIGTFLAVIVAAAIAAAQIRATRSQQARLDAYRLLSNRQAATEVATIVGKFVQSFGNSVDTPSSLDALRHIKSLDGALRGYDEALGQIVLGDLRDAIMCERIFVMRSHIINMLEMIENLRSYLVRGGSNKAEIGARTSSVKSSATAVMTAASELRERLGLLYGPAADHSGTRDKRA